MAEGGNTSGLGDCGFGPRRAILLALSLIISLIATASIAGPAVANEPFRIEFDENRIQIGPVGNIPIGQLSRGAAIEGTVGPDGQVKIPKGKFTLPVLGIDEPVAIRGFMGIEDEATGTWDPMTGRLEIQARAGIWLSVNLSETLQALQGAGVSIPNLGPLQFIIGTIRELTCGFSPMNVTFTTESTALGSGQRFTKGLDGPGALTADWTRLGPFAGRSSGGLLDINLIACPLLRDALPGLVTGLVGNAIPGLDLDGIDIAGLLSNLDTVDLGPSSLTISRTADQSVPAGLAMSTGRSSIRARAGKVARIPVRITNPGDVPATGVKICPRLSKSSRTRSRCVAVGAIGPGRTVSRNLLLWPKRSTARRPKSGGKGKAKRATRPRTVKLTIVVTGTGLASQARGMTLRVVG